MTEAENAGRPRNERLRMLDGWRAVSILLVLAGHMLPLGPAAWGLNGPVPALGMVIFFNLSGFLITSILLSDPDVGSFLVKRLTRILPLAWTGLIVAFLLFAAPVMLWAPNFLFYANLPPFPLFAPTSHYWSLCLEVQFYAAIALAVLLLGRRGIYVVAALAPAVTAARLATGTTISIVTWLRVDEILAGVVLALVVHSPLKARLARVPLPLFCVVAVAFLLSTLEKVPLLDYLRPYLTALMIGITIARPVPVLSPILESAALRYVATISYALYIIHHLFLFGWFAPVDKVSKYGRRLIGIPATIALAHLSTFHFERRFTDWGHRVARRRRHGHAAEAVQAKA